jgi:transcriptional regulator with XRE-family HTH domain
MTMQTAIPDELTPKQVRAARALLAWSQQDLARQAGVATSTIADFERGHRTPVATNAHAIRAALETAEINFVPGGAIIGPPLPAIPLIQSGAPLRWLSAEDLDEWADRQDGASTLPRLISSLIQAHQGASTEMRFPSDESTRYPGWDGWTRAGQASTYVPEGEAGWEFGSQRSQIAQKAQADYIKRTEQPAPLNPASATFIFVTPRRWPSKGEWARERRLQGPWRDVRVYDADDLVHWIEQTPAVGQWLATRIGKRPPGTRQVDEIWEEWSRATQWPLTEELVLSDRDEDTAQLLRWLRSRPSVLSLQAASAEEVIAFFHATLGLLPDNISQQYRARTLVATNPGAARALGDAPAPLILILTEPDPGLAHSLAERGHFILLAYDDTPLSQGEVRRLAQPTREGISRALAMAGIPEARAEALARDSARDLAILRRLMPSAPGRMPAWARQTPPHALLAALLAGGWDESSEGDRAQLAALANEPYDQMTAVLTDYIGELDSPLRKIGPTWRMASPQDAWMLLARYLTAADIDRFQKVAHDVLGATDPRFALAPDERWMASVHGVHPDYSGVLRRSIGEVLILLALWAGEARAAANARRTADLIVTKLFEKADAARWWSLSRDLRLLAEASPNAFLSAVEEALDQPEPPLLVLFESNDGGLFGTEHLSDLMWALESLAWSPDLLPRVAEIFARLDALDPGGRYTNRPGNSLRAIFLLWSPQTHATLDQRLRILDRIRKVAPDPAWRLMLGILPRGHDTVSPSSPPRWRDFSVDRPETVTWALVRRGADALVERLLCDVDLSASRWLDLLDRLSDIPDSALLLSRLEEVANNLKDEQARASLWQGLRRVLNHHREFPDVDWSLPSADLDRLEAVYQRLAPADPLARVAWLFAEQVSLPNPAVEGWEAQERQLGAARVTAARHIMQDQGVEGILELARLADAPGFLGKALVDADLDPSLLDVMLERALRDGAASARNLAHGILVAGFPARGENWALGLLEQARSGEWGEQALLTILRALPHRRWTWDWVSEAGVDLEQAYWRSVPILWMSQEDGQTEYAVRKLMAVGRARHAVHLAGRDTEHVIPTPLLIELLTEAIEQPFEASHDDHNEAPMFQHRIASLLKVLDQRADADLAEMARLEWAYLAVLEHSDRPIRVLPRALSEEPTLFVDMLRRVFKPSEESGVIDPPVEDPEAARAVGNQAYRLLDLWDRLPGTQDDGSIDGLALEQWIKAARALAKAIGRDKVADSRIGTVLSASPVGKDGNWPAEPVRDALDLFRSKEMLRGFWIGKRNRRGVTTRAYGAGGDLERAEAATYRRYADALAYEYPHTAKALSTLADTYEEDAQRQDEDVARLDWQP